MPRRSDIEFAFRASIVHERSCRRIVKIADFVQELLKVNWDFSMEEANLWIARYTIFFKDITPDHGENKTWFMCNPNGGLRYGICIPGKGLCGARHLIRY